MSDQSPTPPLDPPVEAVPDILASPSEPKKARLDREQHIDNGEGSSEPRSGQEDVPVNVNVQPPTPDITSVSLPAAEEKWTTCHMTWRGRVYVFDVGSNDLVYDFRREIEGLTEVPPERQKLVGLIKGSGKLSSDLDGTRFASLGVKQGDVKFTMIGTPEDQTFKDQIIIPDTSDDFDMLYAAITKQIGRPEFKKQGQPHPSMDPRNLRKIKEKIEKCPIHMMNEPRPGKGLLVLDLDYTIVDTKPLLAQSLPAEECARPYMHEFLEAMYPHYDIVIWSQTHWSWLETKLAELGIIGAEREYKICFVADRTPMFPIFSVKPNGQTMKHEVKPLAYFWAKFPQWSSKNTIHIDDLSRNFAMNPANGIKIRAYKGAGTPDGERDRELMRLIPYLEHLATSCEDFTKVDHYEWRRWINTHVDESGPAEHATQPEE